MGSVQNSYLYGDSSSGDIPIPGIGFLVDLQALKGVIPSTAWYANLMVNRAAGYANLRYVDNRSQVTDGTSQIGKEDARSLGAPPSLFQGQPAAQAAMDLNAPVVNQGTWNVLNTQKGPSFSTRYQDELSVDTVTNLFEHTLTAGVLEGTAPDGETSNRYCKVDRLSTLGFRLTYSTKSGGAMVSYHVSGSPYLTIGYQNVTPTFNTNYQLFYIDSDENPGGINVVPGKIPDALIGGKRFTALYYTGDRVFTVILYARARLSFGFGYREDYKTAVPGTTTSGAFVALKDAPAGTPVYSSFAVATNEVGKLIASAPFQGIVRLVNLAPVKTSGSQPSQWLADWQSAQPANVAVVQAYDQHVDSIPLGGEPAIPSAGTWTYTYESASMSKAADPANLTPRNAGPPLIALNRVDRDSLKGDVIPGATAGSIKGRLYFTAANPLLFQIAVPPAEWFDEQVNVTKGLSQDALATLVKQLTDDLATYPGGLASVFGDGWQKNWAAYPVGKRLTQVGTLIRFAAKVLADTGKSASEIQAAIRPALAAFEACVEKVLAEGFLYDAGTGMVIESSSLANSPYFAENYFNIASQDQIFHYGYFVTAAALAADLDAPWLQKKLPSGGGTYRDVVDCLARNVSSPSAADPYFAPWRSLNWPQGHATASGLNAMYGDGPNEESFAEEGNYWQGLAMWAKLTGDTEMQNVAGVCLARCAAAIRAFVETGSSGCAYSPEVQTGLLNSTYFAVCNIFAKKNQAATWFGGDRPVAIGIEVFTCIPNLLEALVDAKWLGKVYGYYHQPDSSGKALLFEKVDALGSGFAMWYSNLTPFFALTDQAFAIAIMDYTNFALDDHGIGLNTRGVLMFNLAYREAQSGKSAGMPAYVRPVPWFQDLLMGSLKGWITFLDPTSPGSPIHPGKNPPAQQVELMTDLLNQMNQWKAETPLSGTVICAWATATHDNFQTKHQDFGAGSPGAGDWANIVGDLLKATGTTCSEYVFQP